MSITHKLLEAGSAVFLLLGTVCSMTACVTSYPPAYSAESIEGSVVDAETKQPLEGVVITANWELRGGASPGGSAVVGQLMVMEAVTDKNGRFYFPAWGPIRQFKGELHENDPRLILFKSGYEHRILSNRFRPEAEAALESVRRSQWNGKTIELDRFRGELNERADLLSSLTISLGFIRDDCSWKRVPRMILALDSEAKRLRTKGIFRSIYSIDYLPTNEAKCGSPKRFFESYRP